MFFRLWDNSVSINQEDVNMAKLNKAELQAINSQAELMDKELSKLTLFSMVWNSVKLIVSLVFTVLTLGKFIAVREAAIQRETYVKWRMDVEESSDDNEPKSGFFD